MPVTRFGLPGQPDETFVLLDEVKASAANQPTAAADDETRTMVASSQASTTAPAPAGDANAYRLLRQIGQGGVGEVWEAEQTSLAREVAVKRMRRAADRRAGAAQDEFRSESIIAGDLEHPNILPVYDLGRGQDGELLLVMKRVHGKPWKELLQADFAELSVDAFLTRHVPILIAVTQAVAFAHSRGIIHRDIKPAQVLVGAFGEVLLTDWGLAITVGAEHAASPSRPLRDMPTPDTATNPAGTPSLMAPEQTENHGGNLGQHTDVYLLGGTLYYLLTGSYPHSAESSAAAFELARAGERVQSPGARAPERRVPPELEQLCLAALEPQRAARLASAEVFLERLQDYLSGAARKEKSTGIATEVEARLAAGEPDYASCTAAIAALDEARRLWSDNPVISPLRQRVLQASARLALRQGDLSFARLQCDALEPGEEASNLQHEIVQRQRQVARRKLLLRVSTAGVCALLVVIAVGALMFSHRMQNANREIAQREQAAEHALKIAKARGSGAFDLINYVLDDLKTAMDQQLTPERGITFDNRNAISQAIAGKVASPVVKYFDTAKPESWPRDMQLAQATQMLDVGQHFIEMARFDEAQELLQPALAIREKLLGKQSIGTADALVALATVRREKGQFKQAEAMLQRAIAIGETQRGVDDPKTIGYVLALAELFGATRTDKTQLHQAEALYRRAATVLKQRHDPELAMVLTRQGKVLDYLDQPGQAEAVLRHALAVWKTTHAPDDPGVADILSPLANSILNQNRDLKHLDQTQIAEAITLLHRAIAMLSSRLGPNNPEVLDRQSTLAGALASAGHPEKAEALYRKAIAGYKVVYGADSYRTGRQSLSFGFFLTHQKKYNEAEKVLRQATSNLEKTLGPDYLEVGWGYTFLGFVYRDTHRLPQAKVALQRAIKILNVRRGPDNFETVKAKKALAQVESEMATAKK
ncbi:MAG TPA: tetratricopeptide repeat protein [Rhodanobacteraceae bacterium]|nr:tetratricopeptide repeat protein [Rhodanobacteraceae bacterium]